MILERTRMETFAGWIRSQRRARKMSMSECARRANVSQPTWAQYETVESAQMRRETVEKIAVALGVPISEAFKVAFPPPQPSRSAMLHIHDGNVDAYDANGDGVTISQADYEWLQMAKRLLGQLPSPDKIDK